MGDDMDKVKEVDNGFNHGITLVERKNIVISGVKKIESFDSEEFLMETTLGYLVIKGNELEIIKLDTYQGNVSIKGKIDSMVYLDSNNKKSEFQRYVINKLKLTDINVINDRAENFFKTGRKYDLVVARAVSNMPVLDELCIPFLKIGGNLVLMKADASTELENSKSGIKILGGEINDIQKFNLPKEGSLRTLIKITKVNETPSIYPRNYDKITKKPLK